MEFTDREKAIRAAAIIDTDGCIAINKYHIYCSVLMTGQGMLDWLESIYGGHQYSHIANHKDGYTRKTQLIWRIYSRQAETFIRAIHPFLILKQGQAECALELRSLQGYHTRKITLKEKQELWQPYADRMKLLNQW